MRNHTVKVCAGLAAGGLLLAACSSATQDAAVESGPASSPGAAVSSAPAHTGAPPLGAGGFITYSFEASTLRNEVQSTATGTKRPDGSCVLAGTITLPHGQNAIVQRVVALNPATCEQRIVTGTPTAEYQQKLDSKEGLKGTSSSASPPSAGDSHSPPKNVGGVQSEGFLRTYIQDPPNITVSSVRDTTEWVWDGNSVVGINGAYEYNWFWPTSWSLDDSNWENSYDPNYQTRVSSWVLFLNRYFCANSWTYSDYDRNTVNGRKNGDLVGEWRAWSYGSTCAGWLTTETELERTKN